MSYTSIRRAERLTCIQIDDDASRPLFPTATIREFGIGHEPYRLIERIVKSMACSGVLVEYHVFSCTTQSFHILPTPINGHIVVVHAVKEPNGIVADILIVDIRRVASSIKGDVGGELDTRRAVYAPEAPHTRIEGDKASF